MGARPHATTANTLAAVGQRLFRAETRQRGGRGPCCGSSRAIRASSHAVADRATRPRCARGSSASSSDPRLHVVRIRATTARGELINDVGGPYVLAPASGPCASHGRRIGTVTLSVQDDAGYIKLLHRFTGAGVALRGPTGLVPGSTTKSGTVGFTVRAFPTGALRVALRV